MEMFTRMAGVDIVHIPYKGGAPATVALIAGEVQLLLSGTTGLPHIKSGKARALATTGATRASALPDVPTVIEAGLPGYTNTNWLGLFAPAKTPAPVIARLNREFVQALRAPDVQKLLAERNYDVVASTPQEFSQVIEQGLREYGKLIRDAVIKPD
jgi:tripartite-type tricarboxylate transporter receptor subunit TctC